VNDVKARGFTLIELMVVVALIAIASAVASLSLRDPQATRLENEASRLVSLLESARSESRALGVEAFWIPHSNLEGVPGFQFKGLPASEDRPSLWLSAGVSAQIKGRPMLTLGPEPMIGPQQILLRLDDRTLVLETDGLGPFVVTGDSSAPGPS
jgi:general secretion pathway protein H